MRVSECVPLLVASLYANPGVNKAVISQCLCVGKSHSHFRRLGRVKANNVDSDVTVRVRLGVTSRRAKHNTLTARPSSQITKPSTTLTLQARTHKPLPPLLAFPLLFSQRHTGAKAKAMSSSYNNFNMRDCTMADAAMQSGIPDVNMQDCDMQDAETQDATMQDARPSFLAAAFAGLENSESLLALTSPNDSTFGGLMALLDNRLNSLDIERPSVGNKRVKPPTSRQNESEQVPLDEADIEHAFACAEGRSRVIDGETDDSEKQLVAALTAAFEEDLGVAEGYEGCAGKG